MIPFRPTYSHKFCKDKQIFIVGKGPFYSMYESRPFILRIHISYLLYNAHNIFIINISYSNIIICRYKLYYSNCNGVYTVLHSFFLKKHSYQRKIKVLKYYPNSTINDSKSLETNPSSVPKKYL